MPGSPQSTSTVISGTSGYDDTLIQRFRPQCHLQLTCFTLYSSPPSITGAGIRSCACPTIEASISTDSYKGRREKLEEQCGSNPTIDCDTTVLEQYKQEPYIKLRVSYFSKNDLHTYTSCLVAAILHLYQYINWHKNMEAGTGYVYSDRIPLKVNCY